MRSCPRVITMRERNSILYQSLEERLQTVLPASMAENNIDMWLIICQEDDLDPVFRTMIPMATWCPILQILVFYDTGNGDIEGINISRTNMGDLYDTPWKGSEDSEQWETLRGIIEKRDPKRIGINIGSIQWAAGGLTRNLYLQLRETLPDKYSDRLISAEVAATRWLANLTDREILLFDHVVDVADYILSDTFSRNCIIPGQTTLDDLLWHYWQKAADLGVGVSFKPGFYPFRSDEDKDRYGADDRALRPGDFVRCDVGITYLRLNSDHQRWVYIKRPGESLPPVGMQKLMAEANRLQDVFLTGFEKGLTGNELLIRILARAREAGISNPKVYSHSLGFYLHEPGPLIGLPWEQECCEGRGDVKLDCGNAFTMELSVEDIVPEWGGQSVRFALEEDVIFTEDGCRVVGERQREFYLI